MCKLALFALAVIASSCSVTWADKLSDACSEPIKVINEKKQGFKEDSSYPTCVSEMEEKYYPEGWNDLPAMITGIIKLHSEVPQKEKMACGMKTFKWMHENRDKMKDMMEGVKASMTEDCMNKMKQIGDMVLGEM